MLEPLLDGGNRAVGQKIEDVMGLSINQNSAKHPPTPKGEFINAHHARRGVGRCHERANAGQHGIGAPLDAERGQQARTRFATERQADQMQPDVYLHRAARVGSDDPRKSLGENAAGTVHGSTEESTGEQGEAHRDSMERKVNEATEVVRMDTGGGLVTQRTGTGAFRRLHMGGDRVSRRREFDERQSIRMGNQRIHEQPSS
jgi:hypothetical protein